MTSIAACANVYCEANAIGGWLESASQWADHITVYHTGPNGEYSTDGTIEIAEKFGAEIKFGSIDEGFGCVRSRMVTMCPTEWVWIGDADERLHRFAPRVTCYGDERYPDVPHPRLQTQVNGVYDQIAALKSLLRPEFDAIVTSRRHWFNHHWDAPCQNFHQHTDWQARILRCVPWVIYDPTVRMHERLIDSRNGQCPRWYQPSPENVEVFHDHYHCFYKAMEPEQRAHDVEIYNRIHEGRKPPTLAEFRNRDGQSVEPQGDTA